MGTFWVKHGHCPLTLLASVEKSEASLLFYCYLGWGGFFLDWLAGDLQLAVKPRMTQGLRFPSSGMIKLGCCGAAPHCGYSDARSARPSLGLAWRPVGPQQVPWQGTGDFYSRTPVLWLHSRGLAFVSQGATYFGGAGDSPGLLEMCQTPSSFSILLGAQVQLFLATIPICVFVTDVYLFHQWWCLLFFSPPPWCFLVF